MADDAAYQKRAEKARELSLVMCEDLIAQFSELSMKLDLEPEEPIDFLSEIPQQEKLHFEIAVNLQGDDLHLNVSRLWLESFLAMTKKSSTM